MVVRKRLNKLFRGIFSEGKIPLIVVSLFWISNINGFALNESIVSSKSVAVVPTPAPNDLTVCAGGNALFIADLGATYKWQYSVNGGLSFSDVTPNGDLQTLSLINVTTSMNGYRYRCVVDFVVPILSATLNVNPLPAAVAGSNRTICQGDATPIGAAAVAGSTYSWTSSPAGFVSTA